MSKTKITKKQEGIFGLIAAFVVLFSTMLDPLVSAMVAVAFLFLFSLYKLTQK